MSALEVKDTERKDAKSTRSDAEREAIRLLRVLRGKFGGLLLVSYEDEYKRNDLNLREKIDAVLAALKESEKE